MKTETVFPAISVINIRCSDPGNLNIGSSKLTCSSGTQFLFEEEPHCVPKLSVKGTRSKKITAVHCSFHLDFYLAQILKLLVDLQNRL